MERKNNGKKRLLSSMIFAKQKRQHRRNMTSVRGQLKCLRKVGYQKPRCTELKGRQGMWHEIGWHIVSPNIAPPSLRWQPDTWLLSFWMMASNGFSKMQGLPCSFYQRQQRGWNCGGWPGAGLNRWESGQGKVGQLGGHSLHRSFRGWRGQSGSDRSCSDSRGRGGRGLFFSWPRCTNPVMG